MHDIEEMAQQRLTPQERREGPDDGPSRACRAEKLSILALGDDGYDQVSREILISTITIDQHASSARNPLVIAHRHLASHLSKVVI